MKRGKLKNRRTNEFFQGRNQTNNRGQILRAGATFIFMTAAKKNWIRMQRRLDVKQASAFRAVKFMGAD